MNYLVTGQIPSRWTSQQKRKFLVDVKIYYFDDPYLFKYCPDQLMRRCVPNDDQIGVLTFYYSEACGGHLSARKIADKILQASFHWPTLFKDCFEYCKTCARCQQLGGVTKRNMMPLTPILIIEIVYCWGIDFMGHFLSSCGYLYILLVVDYVSKWVEAIPIRTNDHKVVLKFLREHIFFLVLECLVRSLVMVGSIFLIDRLRIWLKSMESHFTPYHSQTNGQDELANKEIKHILEKTVNLNPKDWSL